MADALKLRAETSEDLDVLSAIIQDGIGRVGDICYVAKERSLTLCLSRFRYETDRSERVLCGVRFDSIMGLQATGIDRSDPEALLVLLAMSFKPAKAKTDPGGELNIVFAGGGQIKAQVEALDVILADIGPARSTDKNPLHPTDTL